MRSVLYDVVVRLSEFWRLVDEEFGPGRGRMMVDSQVLTELGHRTPADAIESGMPVREVWLAICRHMEVPQERWFGRVIPPKR